MRRSFTNLLPALGTLAASMAFAQQSPRIKPYETCSFPDGLQVVEDSPMPPDVHERPVQSHGKTGSVPLLAGRRIVFGYPGSGPYANVKVELLPSANFAADRKLLLDDFDDMVASDKTVARNLKRKPTQSGLFVTGLDRKELQGNTLGIYLLIDDATHVVATVYLLNDDPSKRPFKSLDEYARMRDTFIYNYTRCIRNNETGQTFGASK